MSSSVRVIEQLPEELLEARAAVYSGVSRAKLAKLALVGRIRCREVDVHPGS